MIEHLSYSSISTYLMCPRSWRFRYIDKVEAPVSPALVFGSAFHDAIEAHVDKRGDLSLEDRWHSAWGSQLETRENIAWDKDADMYAQLGAVMLSAPDTVRLVEAIVPRAIEQKVELLVPGVPIPVIGYIDVIESDGVPADFKTSSRSWSQQKADEELQPLFYLAALNQAGTLHDYRFRYYVFVKNEKRPQVQIWETRREAAGLFWLFGLVKDVWAAIDGGAFPPNPTTWKCSPKWCEYWQECKG